MCHNGAFAVWFLHSKKGGKIQKGLNCEDDSLSKACLWLAYSNTTRFKYVYVGANTGAMGAVGAISVLVPGAIFSSGAMGAALRYNNEAYMYVCFWNWIIFSLLIHNCC